MPDRGVDGAGCCDLSFAAPEAVRTLKAQVVANQLERLGGHHWSGEVEPLSDSGPSGWRTRVRLQVGADARPGFHRYHSDELVTDLRCAQLPPGMLDGLAQVCSAADLSPAAQLHVAVDDDGRRHVVCTVRRGGRTTTTMVQGNYEATQRVGRRSWEVPVTAFWQAHRDAARVYSALVADWAQPGAGMRVWDLYGGVGVFAAVLGDAVGSPGAFSPSTPPACRRGPRGPPWSTCRRWRSSPNRCAGRWRRKTGADVAVLDPPRSGAGRDVIGLLAAAGVPRIVHIGCEAASFARDIGLYLGHGYVVQKIKVFDAFPLTHHTECVALLTRAVPSS